MLSLMIKIVLPSMKWIGTSWVMNSCGVSSNILLNLCTYFSMPKKMSGFHSSTSSADHPFSSLYSSYMSSNRSQNLSSTGQDTSNLTNTSNLSTTSDENVSGSKRTNKKARSKPKNNQLQQLLLKEKKKKEKAQSSSLHSFLASLWGSMVFFTMEWIYGC